MFVCRWHREELTLKDWMKQHSMMDGSDAKRGGRITQNRRERSGVGRATNATWRDSVDGCRLV
jgi:hypothetical protein